VSEAVHCLRSEGSGFDACSVLRADRTIVSFFGVAHQLNCGAVEVRNLVYKLRSIINVYCAPCK